MFNEARRLSGIYSIGELTVIDGVVLKASGMTWSNMRYVRSFFKHQAKWKRILPSEKKIKDKMKQYEIPYETGYIDNPLIDKPKIPYIHIQIPHLWDTITSLATQRYHSGQLLVWPNQADDELLFAIGTDKGGRSTKLLLSWLNHDQPQSDDASFILGLYEGQEDHALMSLVFRELLRCLGKKPDGWCINLSSNDERAVATYSKIMKSHLCKQCNVKESTKPVWLKKMSATKCRYVH